jgi:hypothetical protein
VVLLTLAFLCWQFLVPAELKNKGARIGVSMHGGKFHITYTDQSVVKTWDIKGKVTSDIKGYYYFFDDGKYVQCPIARTVIEEQ